MIYHTDQHDIPWPMDSMARDQRAYEQAKQEFISLWGDEPRTDDQRSSIVRRATEIKSAAPAEAS